MADLVEGAKIEAKEDGATSGATGTSPVEVLRKAVSGKAESKAESAPAPKDTPADAQGHGRRRPIADGRMAVVAGVALALGLSFGLVAAPRERSGDAFARIESTLDANRGESDRLHAQVVQLSKALASLRETTTAARSDLRTIAPSLGERVTKLEQGLDKKFSALVERVARSDREQTVPPASVTAVAEKHTTPAIPAVATTSTAPVVPSHKIEPLQTSSIGEAKPKSETLETWALRDVYDGVAMLEDRKRRLVEVAPGETVPGVGRVEAIERRGRHWVVVTKRGIITTQTW